MLGFKVPSSRFKVVFGRGLLLSKAADLVSRRFRACSKCSGDPLDPSVFISAPKRLKPKMKITCGAVGI
jgi:hypothetical protein